MAWQGPLFMFVVGLCFGSFIDLVVERSARRESYVWPRSHCRVCCHTLSPWEMIPVVSYLYLQGRCRICQVKIPRRHLFVELAVGATAAGATLAWGLPGGLWALGILVGSAVGIMGFLASARQHDNEAGYSLIESAAAAGLLAFVLLPVIQVYVMNWGAHARAHDRLVMVNLVREKLDALQGKAIRFSSVSPIEDRWAWTCVDGSSTMEWRWKVEEWSDPFDRLYLATVEVRKNSCGQTPAGTPSMETGRTIIRQ